jgi:ankyrin repeat protein
MMSREFYLKNCFYEFKKKQINNAIKLLKVRYPKNIRKTFEDFIIHINSEELIEYIKKRKISTDINNRESLGSEKTFKYALEYLKDIPSDIKDLIELVYSAAIDEEIIKKRLEKEYHYIFLKENEKLIISIKNKQLNNICYIIESLAFIQYYILKSQDKNVLNNSDIINCSLNNISQDEDVMDDSDIINCSLNNISQDEDVMDDSEIIVLSLNYNISYDHPDIYISGIPCLEQILSDTTLDHTKDSLNNLDELMLDELKKNPLFEKIIINYWLDENNIKEEYIKEVLNCTENIIKPYIYTKNYDIEYEKYKKIILSRLGSYLKYKDIDIINNAIYNKQYERVDILLSQNKNLINQIDCDSYNPIHYAARHDSKILELLITKYNANIDKRTNYNNTPLILASKINNIESIKILLKYNADTTLKNRDDFSALDYLIETYGEINNVIKYLFNEEDENIKLKLNKKNNHIMLVMCRYCYKNGHEYNKKIIYDIENIITKDSK